MRRRLACLALLVSLTFFSVGCLDRMIFQPSPGSDVDPQAMGIPSESLFLETSDGVRIHAWFLPATERRITLLFLHGNAGNASHRLPNAVLLTQLGADVLLLEYRGYGLSEDVRPSEIGVYADAQAGLDWLMKERGVAENEIVIFGRSLGGAVAVDLARGRDLAGLILESTFTSIADVAKSLLGLPFRFWLGPKMNSHGKIGEVRCPILFIHGAKDRLIRPSLGRKLFEAANEPKEFSLIPGAGHNDVVRTGGTVYADLFAAFLSKIATRP